MLASLTTAPPRNQHAIRLATIQCLSAPHGYIPDGPVEVALLAGYCRPEIRWEAFAALLEGGEPGAYDGRMIARLGR